MRRIIRREVQNGSPFVVMACGHVSPGIPAAGRHSKYYPCVICADAVEEYRRAARRRRLTSAAVR